MRRELTEVKKMHSKKFLHDESWTMIILEEVTFELGWYYDTK